VKKQEHRAVRVFKALLHGLLVVAGAVALTLALFLILPLMQTFAKGAESDLVVRKVDTGDVPPPPPPTEEEPEEDEQPEEQPPELEQDTQPLDLSQLELALDPGAVGEGFLGGDFEIKLETAVSSSDGGGLFALADLDQEPRVVYQPGPVIDTKVRRKGAGTVWFIFVVDQDGRVEMPKVQSSSDPVFERPALAALKQWRFEPGKRGGEPVRSRLRVPITFPGTAKP
jgi:protein TonB